MIPTYRMNRMNQTNILKSRITPGPTARAVMLFLIVFLILDLPLAALTAQRFEQKPTREASSSFAIFTDARTLAGAREAILAYREAVEADGLATWVIADDWKRPEEVRAVLARLVRASPPLEGAVFIGRIPVVMLRDAQHLTSAFKMDPVRYSLRRSSVPTDRYYEDLDLVANFLESDPKEPLLHYYSLTARSPQRIQKEIYSGRILPGDTATPERLGRYLGKVVQRKKNPRALLRAMVITGHGYNSGSLVSWAGQGEMFREQMPWLFRPGGRVDSFNHDDHPELKALVLRRAQEPDLNLLVFHAHGAASAQYLVGLPRASGVQNHKEAIQRHLRARIRRAKKKKEDVDKLKAELARKLDVPDSWFQGAFDAAQIQKDEAADATMDIRSRDLAGLALAPEVVVFDECFNGRFIEPDFAAGAYVFGDGGTVAAIGNSVNILQDVWADEGLGLLGYGVRLGHYHRQKNHLESHLIGDPTFRFQPRDGLDPSWLQSEDPSIWPRLRRLAGDDRAPTTLRTLAIRRLYLRHGRGLSAELRAWLLFDASDVVRLTALKCLVQSRVEELPALLQLAIQDPQEMIRRQTARIMGEIADPAFLAALLKIVVNDPSPRVEFQAKGAIHRYEPAVVKAALEQVELGLSPDQKKQFAEQILRRSEFLEKDLMRAQDPEQEARKRIQSIRTFRLYRVARAVPVLLKIACEPKTPEVVRIAAWESLGWYGLSPLRGHVVRAARAAEADATTPQAIRDEAQKTRRRLEAGLNDAFTP